MDMDGKTLEKFKVMLDQKNADRQAALDQESLDLDKKAQAIDEAWKRTEQLGYVDQAASLVLGVPVGTKAAWAQQAALEQANALENLRVQNEYAKQNQASQAATEKSLIEYKAALDQASQERILAQQYANDKAIAQQTYANNLAIASGSYKSAGGTSTVVKYGMSGASVKALQTALKARGYNIAVDGNFGPATLAAVKSFQKANGLAVDGVAGPKTLAKLG
jgi:murein L,D-transpeptidase YcbB/YkuD